MSENRNMILTLVISVVILWGFHFVTESRHQEALSQNAEMISKVVNQITPEDGVKGESASIDLPRDEALAQHQRILIKTSKLSGSINLTGALLDDLSLLDYKEVNKAKKEAFALLSPASSKDPYYAKISWNHPAESAPHSDSAGDLPEANTVWSVVGQADILTPKTPVKLRWTNPSGVIFDRTFSIDERYMMTITDEITNRSKVKLTLEVDHVITRGVPSKAKNSTSVYEGGIGCFNETLKEIHYDKLKKGETLVGSISDGWVGFTDKYWLTSFVVKDSLPSQVAIAQKDKEMNCEIKGAALEIKPEGHIEYKSMFFAGAKVLEYLDDYSVTHGVTKFDLAVDFGWLYFLTKPVFYLLKFFYGILGNLGIAIILLTILSKVISYPLAKTSYRSMSRMKGIQPKIELLKQRYGDNKVKMNEEMLKLYKKEQINPVSGCLPLLIQMPIFFCLYKVFTISIEMRQAPFMLWIQDLSAPDPTSLFNLFGLIPWDPPSFLQIGILPLIMGGTMFLQQKLTPQPTDPTQAKMMYIMPLVFLFMFSTFPSGLVLYWTVNNILSIVQQLSMNRGVPKVKA